MESHLEYCPWRSPDAQDTEITVSNQEESGVVQKKEKASGYTLVCQAMAKDNSKKQSATTNDGPSSLEGSSRPVTFGSMLPEQREKKRIDLLRRIKELKKPFKGKSLWKKKEKA